MAMTTAMERRLNRHAPAALIGGVFFTISILFYLTMCNMPCEDRTYGLDADVWRRSKNKAFWSDNLLSPSRDLQAKLVILIISAPGNIHERDTIRDTWLKDIDHKAVLFRFVIGTSSLDSQGKDKIDREALVHKDLLALATIADSYQQLTLKVLEAFKWLDSNVDFQYVLKVDDDSYVRVSNILSELSHKPKDHLYWGFFDGRANVKTQGQWKETKWILCDTYLPYARGGGYVISSDLVHFIAHNHQLLEIYLSEDVSVGTWLAPLKINRHHDQRFDTEYISRGCSNSYLITHKQSVLKLRELHNNLLTKGSLCKTEFVERASYEYNWNFPPSKCCSRPAMKKGLVGKAKRESGL
ncbi:beta-1,3-galactosyltransferase 6-like [Plakobranchus ocellatus]|uniref:Hexosyltransferase n=1 Tax=Plakobranchus ocellatus TaxID=259542 RepID=A0AAV3ZRG8_9GAST|nr:beta-1,3-galactosyltransferase 6-like [Plakobranchus ocellatus]